MKTAKKIIAMFLTVIMIIATISTNSNLIFTAFAETLSGVCGDNLTWSLNTATGELIISGEGDMYDYEYINIFASSNSPWNDKRYSIKTIKFDGNITHIGKFAFYDCIGLNTLSIPDSITVISEDAFSNCINLKTVIIPNSVTTIEDFAFTSCYNLKNIDIPDSVTSIGKSAFAYCGLESVIVPDSVESLGEDAFWNCYYLTTIKIPDSKFYKTAFYYNNNITSITLSDKVTIVNEYAFAKKNSTVSSIIIPESVKSIGAGAFKGCAGLTEITIPDGVTCIEYETFEDCTGLTDITIPDGVTCIKQRAFRGCTGLTEITIPSNVESIDEYAFYGCSNLGSVDILGEITSIAEGAFMQCVALSRINIPDTVTEIDDNAFCGCVSLTEITIPKSVTRLGMEAFYGCTGIVRITVPVNLTDIEKRVFAYCTALKRIEVDFSNANYSSDEHGVLFNKDKTQLICCPAGFTGEYNIPDGVTVIDDYAFENCGGLTNLTIPNSVRTIWYRAFYNTSFYNDERNWEDGALYIDNCFITAKNDIVSCHIKEGTRVIATYAFYGCDDITSISIPHSVNSIGSDMLYGCEHVSDIYYDGTKTDWNKIFIGDYNNRLLNASIHFKEEAAGFSDVADDAFYAQPVDWAVESGITNGTGDNTFSPNNKCTRGQVVTFLWRAAGSPEPESGDNPFADIKESDYYYKAVMWAVEKNITAGISQNKFSPGGQCTRGQVVTFLWRNKNEIEPTVFTNAFKDVIEGAYYYKAMLWAVESGITNGTAKDKFSPENTCTRAQVVTFLYRAIKQTK